MRITVKQLKRLIRETVQDIDPMELEREAKNASRMDKKEDLFQLYSDMHKEMYNIRPRWLKLEEVSEDELRALIEHLEERYEEEIKSRQQEAQDQERIFLDNELKREREEAEKAKAELAAMGYEGMEDLENLPMKSGMGKRLAESIRKAVREALKGDQDELDVAPPFGKLTGDDFKKLGKKSNKKAEEKDEDE